MLLSFTTLTLLLVQNSFSFSEMTKQMELNLEKNNLIDEVASLTEFITALQTERVTVAQGLFISMSSGKYSPIYQRGFVDRGRNSTQS